MLKKIKSIQLDNGTLSYYSINAHSYQHCLNSYKQYIQHMIYAVYIVSICYQVSTIGNI